MFRLIILLFGASIAFYVVTTVELLLAALSHLSKPFGS